MMPSWHLLGLKTSQARRENINLEVLNLPIVILTVNCPFSGVLLLWTLHLSLLILWSGHNILYVIQLNVELQIRYFLVTTVILVALKPEAFWPALWQNIKYMTRSTIQF